MIRKELEKTGNIHVEMTREEDVFVSLKERLEQVAERNQNAGLETV